MSNALNFSYNKKGFKIVNLTRVGESIVILFDNNAYFYC